MSTQTFHSTFYPTASSRARHGKFHPRPQLLCTLFLVFVLSVLRAESSPPLLRNNDHQAYQNLQSRKETLPEFADRNLQACDNIETVEELDTKLDECATKHPFDSDFYAVIQVQSNRLVRRINRKGGKCKDRIVQQYTELCQMLDYSCPCPLYSDSNSPDTSNSDWLSCCLVINEKISELDDCCKLHA